MEPEIVTLQDAPVVHGVAPFEVTEVKASHPDDEEEDGRSFEGLLSTYEMDLQGDVIEPGAFKRTLSNWKQGRGRLIPLLDQHDRFGSIESAVGKLLEAEEVKAGLRVKFGVVPEGDPRADAVMVRLKGGFVTGLSIGYRPVRVRMPTDEERRKLGINRFLKEVELKEGSVAIFPSNQGARVDADSVKSALSEMFVTINVDAGPVLDASRLLDLAKKDGRTEDEEVELSALCVKFAASTADDGGGLSPEDPVRLQREHDLRDLKLRGLATRHRSR